MEEELPATAREALQAIHKAATDATTMTARIRSAMRSEPASAWVRLDLSEIAREALAWTRNALPALAGPHGKRVTFEDRLPASQPVLGNAGELREACVNLLRNAVDAVTDDGLIIVAGGGLLPGEARLTIQDNGVGMSEEVLSRLFQPLFTTKGAGGTGLGLVTTYATVQRHGGQIMVDSALGEGTTFTISLPLAP